MQKKNTVAVTVAFDVVKVTKEITSQVAAMKHVPAAKREELVDALVRKAKRAAYMKERNKRPDVRAARTEYNRKRWQEDKALLALARTGTGSGVREMISDLRNTRKA